MVFVMSQNQTSNNASWEQRLASVKHDCETQLKQLQEGTYPRVVSISHYVGEIIVQSDLTLFVVTRVSDPC